MTKKPDTRESLRIVTSNDILKVTGLEDISLKARKLLFLSLAQCKIEDREFYKYKLKAVDFAKFMGIDVCHVYDSADQITDELMKGFLKYIPEGEKTFEKFQLFKICRYTKNAEIEFCLSKEMSHFMLGLKKDFSQPLLYDFAKMNSTYSMDIWYLMQREMKSKKPYGNTTIEFELTVEEIRFVTGTQNKFEKISHFKEKVLNKAIREIRENCNVDITYTDIKIGKRIVAFHFTAKSVNYMKDEYISEDIKNKIQKIKEI